MGEMVSEDDVVRLTAVAALECGQPVVAPDGRIGIVQNQKPVAIGEVATLKMKGIVEFTAAGAMTVPCIVGVNLTTKQVNTAGTASTVPFGSLVATVSSGGKAQISLNEYGLETSAVGASTAAAGSTTSDAAVLPAATARVYPTSGADGTKGVRLHADDNVTGRKIFVTNTAAAILKVYPPTGGTVNGGSANAAVSSVSGKGVYLVCVDGTAGTWAAL